MRNSTGTRIGISVNKSDAAKKYALRDTVFRKGSSLNTRVNFYEETARREIGYKTKK